MVGDMTVNMMVNAPLSMREAQFVSFGLGSAAVKVAEAVNADMGRCLLALYRSAKQPVMRNWGRDLEKAAAPSGTRRHRRARQVSGRGSAGAPFSRTSGRPCRVPAGMRSLVDVREPGPRRAGARRVLFASLA